MQKMDRCIIRNQKSIMSLPLSKLPKNLARKLRQMRKIVKTIMERMGIAVMGKTKLPAKKVEGGLTVARYVKHYYII